MKKEKRKDIWSRDVYKESAEKRLLRLRVKEAQRMELSDELARILLSKEVQQKILD